MSDNIDTSHMSCYINHCNNMVIDSRKITFRNYSGYQATITVAWCDQHNLSGDIFIDGTDVNRPVH